jgi:hypothetical protein
MVALKRVTHYEYFRPIPDFNQSMDHYSVLLRLFDPHSCSCPPSCNIVLGGRVTLATTPEVNESTTFTKAFIRLGKSVVILQAVM